MLFYGLIKNVLIELMTTEFDDKGFATRAVRSGQTRSLEGEHSEPIFATSSFVFDNAEQAAARFSGEQKGNIYSRFTNPTVRTFEQRMTALEGGEAAIATSSGMSAILSTFMALLSSGDHIVASRSLFASTRTLFDRYLAKFGVEVSHVDLTDLTAWQNAIKENTKAFFLESPSNPLNEIADLAALSELAKNNNSLLIVDNCFCTPALQRPLALGADIVVHSATKYIDGQGRCVGGIVVANDADLIDEVYGFLRTAGPTMSPFNAWVFSKGLETLNLRMKAHSENAMQVAQWLEEQAVIERVYYAGLNSHKQHQLAVKQQLDFGGIVAFEVTGGREAAWQFIDATQWLSITANLGDSKTTITHPATTTHGKLTDQERNEIGISENLIRLSIGLEDVEDIKEELKLGLLAVGTR